MKKAIVLLMLCMAGPIQASTTDCKDLFVGRIWIEKGVGLKAVVYLNNKTDTSGSYWSYYSSWQPEERKEALSLLLAAKASGHRVNVVTENADGCGLQDGGTVTKSVYLTTNP